MGLKIDQLKKLYSDLLVKYPGGMSNTSTKKFDPIKLAFSDWLQIPVEDIYATGAATRPSNLEVRLSQGLQAIKHTKLGLAFLLDESNTDKNRERLTDSTLVTIKKFLGRGKAHYDAILILVQSNDDLYVTNLAYKSDDPFVESLKAEFELEGILIEGDEVDDEESEYDIIVDDYQTIDRFIDAVEEEGEDESEVLMAQPFNPALIDIDTRYLTVDLLVKRLSQSESEIDLTPEFQRMPNLWDNTRKSRLIESILIRFPLPAFYFDGSNKNKWLVVDGLQRLWTLKDFIIDKTLRLTNLEFLDKLNNRTYNELDRDLQRIIEETQIVAYIINPGTPEDVKYNIFKRINTGGLTLVPQEIRHALHQGKPATFIAELANCSEFKRATGNSIKGDRMLDRDFVNRFFSFYLFGYKSYAPDLDTFMSKAMGQIYRMSDDEQENCLANFKASMELNIAIFGHHAFRKIDGSGKIRPINKALFEVFAVSFAQLTHEERIALTLKSKAIYDGLINLLNTDKGFYDSISTSTGDKQKVILRFDRVKNLILRAKLLSV